MKLAWPTGNITKIGYFAITLTTLYTIIITVLGLKTMRMVKYIYESNKKTNGDK
ncbi:hypothetical protein KDJ21_003890 [Metabacillus litoralis]|uniref:hypothetical protein n=1 Tax=Metabacillus litoralis TaxID=152268 RepID=UPI001B9CC6BF|nr:hypothetical protein [Metabacillus litoralis]UHA60855.1 hypothetical protein KDJ21_003890 [Metabacillus litoralis]